MMRLRLVSLGLWLTLLSVVLAPAASHARCAPAAGWQLHLVAHDAPAGTTALFELAAVRTAPEAIALPLTTVTIRATSCRAHCTTTLTPRAIAANLFAIDLPATLAPGDYSFGGHGHFTVVAARAPAAAPTRAPVLAATPFGQTMVGTGAFVPTLELAAAAPSDAIGTLVRWGTTTWFVSREAGTHLALARRRCSPAIPGVGPLAVGDAVEARFVSPTGQTSPAVTLPSAVALAP